METTRRQFFSFLAALPFSGWLMGMFTEVPLLEPTPACDDGDEPTPAQTEGPYFTPNSPQRSNLREDKIPGTTLVLSGQVLNTKCQPVKKALLDWWHCDDKGVYDNEGYTLRGHQYTDEQGFFKLETIVPGMYTGRTRHLHVKVQAPGKAILTTQLYFPEEAGNERDRIFNHKLLVSLTRKPAHLQAGFTFVVKT
ncbi:intradiol ring-cleavage dioxygenase [Rhodocytophaga aerolata]|uniref:Intradiol ring-cleavage dioxygenase n=1 Tax=Rhodocytophaga aerolata TaxID=455078 RepID=A0ABT8RBJ5_9BACT|nr:intradiol ring-cleavage dioxygenase [Rhodocytophaga aerolata]MDO1449445.1 intradiol ring-cleavage dioxygenase [Rhodocytophaga aerolata]